MTPLKALVVDDESSARMLLEAGVRNAGFDVDSAEDGSQASRMITENYYDLVVTDLIMPGKINGVGVLEAAKKRSGRTSVVMVTGHASVKTAVEAMKKGAEDYLQKPIHMDELTIKLGKLRDWGLLVKDTQDLQEAMDVTEKSAAETIRELESTIQGLREAMEKVRETLASDNVDQSRKIERVLEIINNLPME